MSTKTKPLIVTAIVIVAIVAFIVWQNKKDNNTSASVRENKPVVIAYQTGVDPSKVAQANGDYEKIVNVIFNGKNLMQAQTLLMPWHQVMSYLVILAQAHLLLRQAAIYRLRYS